MDSRREQILAAARAVFAEAGAGGVSVRSVAARAGIGASTLRHYFPSQQHLHEAIFAATFDSQLHDLRIHDPDVPARERLRECMAQFLLPAEQLDQAFEGWFEMVSSIIGTRATPAGRTAWVAFVRRAHARVTGWLEVVAAEGALREGDPARHARLLIAVVDGLALGMILPEVRPGRDDVVRTMHDAIDAVLANQSVT